MDVKGAASDQRCCPLSHQQVSLARSPPLKDEDGQRVGLLLTSYDRTLVVKEISSEEVEEMHNILSEYHQVGLTQVETGLLVESLNVQNRILNHILVSRICGELQSVEIRGYIPFVAVSLVCKEKKLITLVAMAKVLQHQSREMSV